ncbi:MAG: tryptophan-rich sensory protein [Clostridia bacterium]|nr:tryptophan-rich sensory protein [Clostridia bacterium]
MRIRWKTLLICIAIPLAVGGAAALLTMGSMETFGRLNQPPLSPPAWLFPVVWTLLYTLMGIASYLVVTSHGPRQAVNDALRLYAAQLAVNFFWSILFFNFGAYLLSFLWLLLLWGLILATLVAFYRLSPVAGYLLVPYLAWVTFAGYLNFAIYLLN